MPSQTSSDSDGNGDNSEGDNSDDGDRGWLIDSYGRYKWVNKRVLTARACVRACVIEYVGGYIIIVTTMTCAPTPAPC